VVIIFFHFPLSTFHFPTYYYDIRCDNCSVSLQLDEGKIPTGNFTVRCPRCQNLIRVQKGAKGHGSATVQQLEANKPAPAVAKQRAAIFR
jgi:predicted Zn finger-like uncharacterized protein